MRRLRGNDPRVLRLRPPASPPNEEHKCREDRVANPAQDRNLLPSSRQKMISTGIARNQVTSPSGTGPRKPSPQPPGRAGFFVNSTYRTIESSCRLLRSCCENFGITYGPIRTASATWSGVALTSAGGSAPVTTPPCATTWWQPAQCSVNRDRPRDT